MSSEVSFSLGRGLAAQEEALFRAVVEGVPCPGVSNVEGLAAYQRSYRIRLEETLASDFPVTLPLLPENLRSAWLEEFFRSAPSSLFTLHAFGALWVDFLHGRAAELERANPELLPGLPELAAFEWKLVLARFRDSGLEPERPLVALPTEPPFFARLARALELIESSWPLAEMYEQEKLLPPEPSRVAIWREADGRASYRELEELPFLLLQRLARGLSWGEAMAGWPETAEFAAELQEALAHLAEDGLLVVAGS